MLTRRASAADPAASIVAARGGRRAAGYLQLIAGLIALFVAIGSGWLLLSRRHHVDTGTVPTGRPTASLAARAVPADLPRAPDELSLPALGISAHVVAVRADASGALGVPTDIAEVGWWADGVEPGTADGSVVVDGHVDSAAAGTGAFFSLDRTPLGAPVTLSAGTAHWTYRVVARRSYPKQQLPADVFARSGAPRLVLITCGGHFDRATGHYADNTVVYATPV